MSIQPAVLRLRIPAQEGQHFCLRSSTTSVVVYSHWIEDSPLSRTRRNAYPATRSIIWPRTTYAESLYSNLSPGAKSLPSPVRSAYL